MKRLAVFAALSTLLASGCSLPWNRGASRETNIAFHLRTNQIVMPTVTVDGKSGTYLLDVASLHSTLHQQPAPGREATIAISPAIRNRVTPDAADLRGMADAMIGRDAWRGEVLTIDYRRGLLIFGSPGIGPEESSPSRYSDAPSVEIRVGGKSMRALLDTTLPDTLIVPSEGPRARTVEKVAVAGYALGPIEIARAPIPQARIGNRLLARFMVTINDRSRIVTMWPYQSYDSAER